MMVNYSKDKEEISLLFQQKKLPSILGNQDFVKRVKNLFFQRKAHIEVPDSKLLAPDKETIQQLICKTYGITKEELIKSKRGLFNEPRGVAIYLTRVIRSDGLMDICRDYNLKKYSSASSVVDGVKQKLSKDRRFRNRVKELADKLIKSQTEPPLYELPYVALRLNPIHCSIKKKFLFSKKSCPKGPSFQ
jgi:hypothetical protein